MADADGSAAGSPDPTQHSTKPDLGSKVGNSDSQAPESVFSITICREMKIFTMSVRLAPSKHKILLYPLPIRYQLNKLLSERVTKCRLAYLGRPNLL